MNAKAPPPPHTRFKRSLAVFLGLFDHWLRLSCRTFMRLASEKHERPLTWGERVKMPIHRVVCRVCEVQEWRIEQLRETAHDLGRHAHDDEEVELSPESLEKLRKAMAEASKPSPKP